MKDDVLTKLQGEDTSIRGIRPDPCQTRHKHAAVRMPKQQGIMDLSRDRFGHRARVQVRVKAHRLLDEADDDSPGLVRAGCCRICDAAGKQQRDNQTDGEAAPRFR